ncbi:MAG: nucleotide exchange factor GrpE [Betaproteobacteria bacterium]|nr:nucleotide exchange factor GrpE [Betaproteobacteria bacterium]
MRAVVRDHRSAEARPIPRPTWPNPQEGQAEVADLRVTRGSGPGPRPRTCAAWAGPTSPARTSTPSRAVRLRSSSRSATPLEQSLSAGNATPSSCARGVELTLKALTAAFDKSSIVPLDPAGEKFDPNRHQAMAMIRRRSRPRPSSRCSRRATCCTTACCGRPSSRCRAPRRGPGRARRQRRR